MNGLILILAVMALLLSACTPSQPAQAPETTTTTTTTTTAVTTAPTEEGEINTLRFSGKVLEVNDGMALMECYDKTKFDTVLVNYSNTPSVTPQVGEQYIVVYEDFMMPSLPPRIFATEMTLLYSEPLTE